MNITLPILLLVVGAITFWILNESKLKWYIRTGMIASFCAFTIFFYSSIHTFLGWAANQNDIPEKVSIHWVIIKEPNKLLGFDGGIYVLIESAEQEGNTILKFIGYKQDGIEPRLHEMSYNRKLHEQLQAIQSRLKNGQPVLGTLREKKSGNSKKGNDNGGKKKGEGSESQETEWEFHELRPSDFLNKPE
tara:strand:- start:308 stop:877 length:570 start_codon:yes stop_codon:yes gene_type:complete